ncbi:MAG: aldolase/citrate lyase family protein [archaeon]|nr:aldolase [Candidatus Micrarchaeota archaeon]MBU1887027.1 aldolase [Candidatus Micrarchaeota archaeon]
MMNENRLKKKLENNEKTLGTWCVVDSPTVVDIMATTGLDFIIIDAEHGPISYETAQCMVMACESHNVSPIMRVGELNEALVLRALDIGIHGLQMPNISNSEDATEFVRLAKYPPIGIRGFSPYTKAGLYDFNNGRELTKKANENVLLIANVEGVEGVENIEEISKVKHIDIIFVGLFDLSKSLGIPGDVENPKVMEKLKHVIDVVKKNGKKVGSIASNKKMLKQLMKLDIDYVTYSVDSGMIKEAYSEIVEEFRNEQ